MNKFFNLSLVALICATLFTSCENNGNQNNNDSKEGNISQNVLVANLPQNFKATTKYTLTSVMNTRTEANSTLTKFGADWILDYDFFSTDASGVETRQSRVYYLRFDENGKILKQFESADEGKNWAVMDKYLDFSHFAESGSNTARRLLDNHSRLLMAVRLTCGRQLARNERFAIERVPNMSIKQQSLSILLMMLLIWYSTRILTTRTQRQ